MPATASFTAQADMVCVVTSSGQAYTNVAIPAGASGGYFRAAIFVGANPGANDGAYGHYVTSNGSTGYQPDISRTATFSVSAGQSVAFGGYLGGTPPAWNDHGNFAVTTTYACS